MVIVVFGVAGTGKTTVGRALAKRLGWTFLEGDDFHSPANVAKMAAGVPLTDEDRAPWLRALHAEIVKHVAAGTPVVLACSALKASYRALLREGVTEGEVRFVLLDGSAEEIAARLRSRSGHFMPVTLLASQLATLERPAAGEALVVSIAPPPEAIVDAIVAGLGVGP